MKKEPYLFTEPVTITEMIDAAGGEGAGPRPGCLCRFSSQYLFGDNQPECFTLPRERLMHNYCLSKQIYTVAFPHVLWPAMQLTGSVSVLAGGAHCVLSLCNVL